MMCDSVMGNSTQLIPSLLYSAAAAVSGSLVHERHQSCGQSIHCTVAISGNTSYSGALTSKAAILRLIFVPEGLTDVACYPSMCSYSSM